MGSREVGVRIRKERCGSMYLADAVDMQDVEQVKQYIEQGADVNQSGWFSKKPVIRAIRQGNVVLVKYLVENGAKVDTDCLNEAIEVGSLPIVKFLVENGVDINKKGWFGKEPTIRAIRSGNAPIVACLVEQKTKNGDRVDRYYLDEAIDVGSLPVVKCLIEKGVDINWQSRFGEDPVIRGIHKGNAPMVAYLIKKGSEEGLKIDIRYLNEAIDAGNLQVVKSVVDCGVNLNQSGWFSKAPVIRGIRKGNVAIVEYLISKGAKVDKNCLDVAIETGNLSMVKCIVRQGVNVNERSWFDDPSIIKAVHTQNLNVVKYLVKHGAKINDRCMNEAVKTGRIEIVKYFISKGYNVKKSSFLLTAVEEDNINMAEYLIRKGSRVNREQLKVATDKGNQAMRRLLIDNGAEAR
ncbi:MAG: ankyrin repeat domain-containing protein [Clostridiales bacterium]|nr:ankyrin repeat domain-containing protein [Clostridiales bacterium]